MENLLVDFIDEIMDYAKFITPASIEYCDGGVAEHMVLDKQKEIAIQLEAFCIDAERKMRDIED